MFPLLTGVCGKEDSVSLKKKKKKKKEEKFEQKKILPIKPIKLMCI
jgi:hypothetical protein